MISYVHHAMGTAFSFLITDEKTDKSTIEEALLMACSEIDSQDNRFSPWKKESELSLYNRGEAKEPSDLFIEVLEECERAKVITAGHFDPWALGEKFNPTGLVKGWTAKRALSTLIKAGIDGGVVNAGGDICVFPGRPYLIGVQDPFNSKELLGAIEVTDAVATSGSYERGDHIVNVKGNAITTVAATVTGKDLTLLDALATALIAGGDEVLTLISKMEDIAAMIVKSDGSMLATANFSFSEENRTSTE
ncbi:MAG: FAD:protein FMN transferase [Actinomycetota bacterium]|nr:FAD:protein FMN transferase [Actinomycetota bacterium]